MLKKFAKQVMQKKAVEGSKVVSSPCSSGLSLEKTPFLKGFARHALSLYEKRTDIKKFAKLALSNPENHSHEQRVKEILSKETEDLFDLANNERLLKDLGIS